jgi:hypothetical protein
MNELDSTGDDVRHYRRMTVANIRDAHSADFVEVVFLESARFYRLEHRNHEFAQTLQVLREALSRDGAVSVAFETPEGEVIRAAKKE